MSKLAGIIDDVVKYHLTCLEAHNQIKALMLEMIDELGENDVRNKENELRNIHREYDNDGSINLILGNIISNQTYRDGKNQLRKELCEKVNEL